MNADEFLDITDVICPMTFVKTKVALEDLDDGQILELRFERRRADSKRATQSQRRRAQNFTADGQRRRNIYDFDRKGIRPRDLEKIFSFRKLGFIYSRIGNPTTVTFERRISDLERGAGAVAFSSGMAAISAAIMNIVESGDEIISSAVLFGGTSALFGELKSFGGNVRYVMDNRVENFAALMTNKTKLLYVD